VIPDQLVGRARAALVASTVRNGLRQYMMILIENLEVGAACEARCANVRPSAQSISACGKGTKRMRRGMAYLLTPLFGMTCWRWLG
jgi:hypothetical protein